MRKTRWRRLRSEAATAQAHYLALTGYGQAHDRTLARAAGFDHHFVKPVDIVALQAVLDSKGTETKTAIAAAHLPRHER